MSYTERYDATFSVLASSREVRHLDYVARISGISKSAMIRMALAEWIDKGGDMAMCHRSVEEVMAEAMKPIDKYNGLTMDEFATTIIKAVEGQIKSYIADHPEVLEGLDRVQREKELFMHDRGHRHRTRRSSKDRLTDSLAKRITRQLLCPQTRERLEIAVLRGAQSKSGDDPG